VFRDGCCNLIEDVAGDPGHTLFVMAHRSAAAWLLPLVLAGCELAPLQAAGDCPSSMRGADGACCAAFTRPVGAGCAEASWRDAALSDDFATEIQVAVLSDSAPVAAWVRSDKPFSGVLMAAVADGADVWSKAVVSGATSGIPERPRLATSTDGSLALVWRDVVAPQGRIVAGWRLPGGAWLRPLNDEGLSYAPDAYDADVAIGAGGDAVVVWNQTTTTGRGAAVATAGFGEADFARPDGADDVLSPPINFSNSPECEVNRRGDAIVSWYQSTGDALNVFVAERTGRDGQFSRPQPGDGLSIDSPFAEGMGGHFLGATTPALDDTGRAAVAWTQLVSDDRVGVFLATRDERGSWQRPSELGDSFSVDTGVACCPRVATTPDGHLLVVWQQRMGQAASVHVAHRHADGRWLRTGREPLALSTPGWRADAPSIAVHPSGGAVVGWIESNDETSRVVARVGDLTQQSWQPPTVLDSGAPNALFSVSVATGGHEPTAAIGWLNGGDVHASVLR
jgi:hypothetical protein